MALTGFFAKVETAFKKFFGEAPTWLHYATLAFNYAAPLVLTIAGAFVGDPEIGVVVNDIKIGLATASAITANGTATPTLASVLTGLKNNFATLLTLAQVKNPTVASSVNVTANLVIGELEAVLGMLPASATTNGVVIAAK